MACVESVKGVGDWEKGRGIEEKGKREGEMEGGLGERGKGGGCEKGEKGGRFLHLPCFRIQRDTESSKYSSNSSIHPWSCIFLLFLQFLLAEVCISVTKLFGFCLFPLLPCPNTIDIILLIIHKCLSY